MIAARALSDYFRKVFIIGFFYFRQQSSKVLVSLDDLVEALAKRLHHFVAISLILDYSELI